MSLACKSCGVALKRAATRYDTVQYTRLPNEPLLSALMWTFRVIILMHGAFELFFNHRYVEYTPIDGGASLWFSGNPLASQGGKPLTNLTESEVPFYCRDSMRHRLYYPYKCQQKMLQKHYGKNISSDPDVLTDEQYDDVCKHLWSFDEGKAFSEHLGCQDFDFINHIGTTTTGAWMSLQEMLVPFECEDGSLSPIDATRNVGSMGSSRVMGCAMNPKMNFEKLSPKQLKLFYQRTTLNILGIEDIQMGLRFSFNTTKCMDQDIKPIFPSNMCSQDYMRPWIKLHRRRRPKDTQSRAPLMHWDYGVSNFSETTQFALNASGHRAMPGITIREWLDYAGIVAEDMPAAMKNTVFEMENHQDWLSGIFDPKNIKFNHPTIRQTGLRINIFLVYSNFRSDMGRHSGIQSQPQIDIYVEPDRSLWLNFKRSRVMWNADRRSGVTVTNSALEFNIEVSGQMGNFSIFAVISALTSTVVMLSLARVLVDILAEFVLPNNLAFKRVRYGNVRVRLEDISEAMRHKSMHKQQSNSGSGKHTQVHPKRVLSVSGLSVSQNQTCGAASKLCHAHRGDTVKDLAPFLAVRKDTIANSEDNSRRKSKDDDATVLQSDPPSDVVYSSSDEKVSKSAKNNVILVTPKKTTEKVTVIDP